jgi:hypothetical protein
MVTPAVAIVLTVLGLFMGVAVLGYFAKKDLKSFFVLVEKARRRRLRRQPDAEPDAEAAGSTAATSSS